jgi:hypothetical protein
MRTWPLIALLSLTPAVGLADTVHLTNGRSFEGVMAEVSGSKVNIRMQGGVVSLPMSQVARIERGESTLEQYLGRKEALAKVGVPSASAWVELALWAQARNLDGASREAALMAARIDPHYAGLTDILRQHGYVLDESLDRWIPYSDSMRRKGLVLSHGEWIARAELDAEERAREEALDRQRARQIEARRAAREERLEELTALAVVRETRRAEAPVYPYYPPTVVVIPGYFTVPVPIPPAPGAPMPPVPEPQPREPRTNRGGFTRVPGSLIPGHYPSGGPFNNP